MSAQRLNARYIRRIARTTGLNVIRAWGHGSYTMAFVTDKHEHGWWDKKTKDWGLYPDPFHYTSCRDLFHDAS